MAAMDIQNIHNLVEQKTGPIKYLEHNEDRGVFNVIVSEDRLTNAAQGRAKTYAGSSDGPFDLAFNIPSTGEMVGTCTDEQIADYLSFAILGKRILK